MWLNRQDLKWTFHPPPFCSKTQSHVFHAGGRVGWELEREGKPLNWSKSPKALIVKLQRKESSYWRGCDPQYEVSLQGGCWGGRAQPASPLPQGRTRGCSRHDGCAHSPQQTGLGTLVESHPEHQMAHQRAESNFSHGIASGSSAHCQFKVVSLPNWLLLSPREFFYFLFLTTAIFSLGIICRIGWKGIDHHFVKFPGFESSSLFVFAWLRDAARAALGVEATRVNKEKSREYRDNFTTSWMCEMWEDSPPLFCCLLMLLCMKSYFWMMKVFARRRQVVMNGIAFEFCL